MGPPPPLAVVTISVTSCTNQAFTMLCAPVLRQPETVLDALRDWTRRTHRHTQAPTGMGTVRG